MALTTKAANLVRQDVNSYTRDPGMHLQLDALFRYLSEHKGNPDLYLEAFADLTADTVISDAACKLYFVYARKQNTATDAYMKITDNATAHSDGGIMSVIWLTTGNDDAVLCFPEGEAHANGCTVNSGDASDGTTDSTSGDGPDGTGKVRPVPCPFSAGSSAQRSHLLYQQPAGPG